MGRGLGTPSVCIKSLKKAGSCWEKASVGVGEANDPNFACPHRCSHARETSTPNPSPPSLLTGLPSSPLWFFFLNKPFLEALFNWSEQTGGLKPEHGAFSTCTLWRPLLMLVVEIPGASLGSSQPFGPLLSFCWTGGASIFGALGRQTTVPLSPESVTLQGHPRQPG